MRYFLLLLTSVLVYFSASAQCLTDFTKLLPEPSIDNTSGYGQAIAMYGDYLAVGVPNSDSLGRFTGIVRVYRYIGDNWIKVGDLAPSDPADALQFGATLKMSQDYLLVGAAGYGGKVYLFKKPASGWTSQKEFASFAVSNSSTFGSIFQDAIEISDDQQTVAIVDGYLQTTVSEKKYYGAVYIYHKQPDEEWHSSIVPLKLLAPEEDVVDFGRGGVKFRDNQMAISTPYAPTGNGAIYIYRDPSGKFSNPVLEARLTSGSSTESSFLGYNNILFTEEGIFTSAVMGLPSTSNVSILYFEKPASGAWADATPTCHMHSYNYDNDPGYVTISFNNEGIYASHRNSDTSGDLIFFQKGNEGWCGAQATPIDSFTSAPKQPFGYAQVTTCSPNKHFATIGFLPHPEAVNSQLALKVLTKQSDSSWSSQLLYPKERNTTGHFFGSNILGVEDNLFVTASGDGTMRPNGGVVYSYKKVAEDWQKSGKIIPPIEGRYDDAFGSSLATNGTYLAVGASGYEPYGKIFVYKKSAPDWSEAELAQEITLPDDILIVFASGDDLAMNDEWLLIPYVQNSPARVMLAIYRFNGNTWDYHQVVEIGVGNLFSKSTTTKVDIEGETIAAGNKVLQRDPASDLWYVAATLGPSDPELIQVAPDFSHWISNGSAFGHDVDISGNTIFISAPAKDYEGIWDVGAIYVFSKKPGERWSSRTETAKILPRVKEERELFGFSIKNFGNTLIVGAPGSDYNRDGTGRNKPGRAYVFQTKDYYWQEVTPLVDFTGDSFVKDYFGISVGVNESGFFTGASIEDMALSRLSGSVYVTPVPLIIKLEPPVCQTEGTMQLTGYPFGGEWSGYGIIDPIQGTLDLSIAGAGTHEFIYKTESCSNEGILKIEIEAAPEAVLLSDTLLYVCESSEFAIPLSVQYSEGLNYLWYYKEEPSEAFFPLNETTQMMSANRRGYYKAKVYSQACEAFLEVVSIKDETIELSLESIPRVCENNTAGVELIASPSGGIWEGNGVESNRLYTQSLPDGPDTLIYTFNSVVGCEYSAFMSFEVDRLRIPVIQRISGHLCAEGEVELSVVSSVEPDVNYEWSRKANDVEEFLPLNHTEWAITTSEKGIYQVSAFDEECLVNSLPYTINDSTFEMTLSPNESEFIICYGQSVDLSFSDKESRNYQWFYQEFPDDDPQLLPSSSGSLAANRTGTYYAIVESGKCSMQSPYKEVFIQRKDSLFIPNVFTPNGDGYNDIFQVISNRETSIDLTVFDRNGKIIFTDNANLGWAGEGADESVYFWSVNYNVCEGERKSLKGLVQLLR